VLLGHTAVAARDGDGRADISTSSAAARSHPRLSAGVFSGNQRSLEHVESIEMVGVAAVIGGRLWPAFAYPGAWTCLPLSRLEPGPGGWVRCRKDAAGHWGTTASTAVLRSLPLFPGPLCLLDLLSARPEQKGAGEGRHCLPIAAGSADGRLPWHRRVERRLPKGRSWRAGPCACRRSSGLPCAVHCPAPAVLAPRQAVRARRPLSRFGKEGAADRRMACC